MTDLPKIPPGIYQYKSYPVFVNWPKDIVEPTWHVFGPAHLLRPGDVAEVKKFNAGQQELEYVEILHIVAERDVAKRNGSRVRYVMATFDRVMQEEDE